MNNKREKVIKWAVHKTVYNKGHFEDSKKENLHNTDINNSIHLKNDK